jgi:hypothetical protein
MYNACHIGSNFTPKSHWRVEATYRTQAGEERVIDMKTAPTVNRLVLCR